MINCSLFNILTNVFAEIIYEPINVGLLVKILTDRPTLIGSYIISENMLVKILKY